MVDVGNSSTNDLVLERIIAAPRAKVWRCWTEPALLMQWNVPRPWTLSRVEMDVRPGGASLLVMRNPEGQEFPNPGTILEVVPGRKLVFTDAYVGDWEPSGKPFMTAVLTFDDDGPTRTKYRAVARHWTAEDRKTHEDMGFHAGWGQCADQLEELAQRID